MERKEVTEDVLEYGRRRTGTGSDGDQPFSVSIPIFSSGSSTDPFHGLEISDHETCGQAFVRQDAVCTAGPGKTGENDLHGEIL